jgi:hypothetical protein
MCTGSLFVVTLATAADVPAPSPPKAGLPELLAFRLEDGRHETAGVSLSFGLPALIEYECRRVAFHLERSGLNIEVTLLGVAHLGDKELALCRMVKEPSPAQERVLLPPEPGSYRVTFVSGARRDSYTLAVTTDTITLVPTAPPAFTTCEQSGEFKRVGLRWLWVDLTFMTGDSFQRMRPKRDGLFHTLEALGAKPFVPPPGRYVLDGFIREIPAAPRPGGIVEEERFFLWDGDWKELATLARRYEKWAHVDPNHSKRPVMTIWFSSRDNVISTYGSR